MPAIKLSDEVWVTFDHATANLTFYGGRVFPEHPAPTVELTLTPEMTTRLIQFIEHIDQEGK